MNIIEKIIGTHSERELKRIVPIVDAIEALRPSMMACTDEQLKDKTKEYKKRYEKDSIRICITGVINDV